MKNVPKKIYLQIGDDCPDDLDFNELIGVSWCSDKINDNDIEYMLVTRDGNPESDTTANDNKHVVVKSVCLNCESEVQPIFHTYRTCPKCTHEF